MLSASIPNTVRKAIYKRDGYMCALCGDTRRLQVHHYCHRSLGGNDTPHNLVTLCQRCHAIAHGMKYPEMPDWITKEDTEQGICEYLADLYAGDWYPYK